MARLACQDFATVEDVLAAPCGCDLNEVDHGDLIEEAIEDASDILYMVSGGRVFGVCRRTVWPHKVCDTPPYPIQERESWIKWDSTDSIPLQGPNTNIIEITVDGIALAPSEYGLLEGNKLFRRGGLSWPTTNDITLTDVDPGTFTITYEFGERISSVTRRAAVELVCQMVKLDSQAISRMRGVVSANVQGVSIQLDDDEMRSLGLESVSRFQDIYSVAGWRPLGVYTPELMHGWRLLAVTGPSGS